MGSRVIDLPLIEALTGAFRQEPTGITRAARIAGCTFRTAQRALERGWPRKGFRPIKQVLVEDQIAARAKMHAEQAQKTAMREKELEDARKSAVQSKAQEGQMITLARTASLQALTVSSQLLAGGRALAAQVKTALDLEAKKPPEEQMSPGMTLSLLARISNISESINRAAHQAMIMERLHLGQPTDIIAHVDGMEDMTLEEADIRIKAAQQALDSVNRTAKLTVIEGGAAGTSLADAG